MLSTFVSTSAYIIKMFSKIPEHSPSAMSPHMAMLPTYTTVLCVCDATAATLAAFRKHCALTVFRQKVVVQWALVPCAWLWW